MRLASRLHSDAQFSESAADAHHLRVIQLQTPDSRTPTRCGPFNLQRPVCRPPKVVGPPLRARTKQINGVARNRIDGSGVIRFVSVAVRAGVSEILQRGRPSTRLRQDVIQFKAADLQPIRDATILTAIVSACCDRGTKLRVDAAHRVSTRVGKCSPRRFKATWASSFSNVRWRHKSTSAVSSPRSGSLSTSLRSPNSCMRCASDSGNSYSAIRRSGETQPSSTRETSGLGVRTVDKSCSSLLRRTGSSLKSTVGFYALVILTTSWPRWTR